MTQFLMADVRALLGKSHVEVLRAQGAPNALFSVRQANARYDDVVFNYEQSFWYFYNNHFYRVLYSSEYTGEIVPGVKIGCNKAALTKAFGAQYTFEDDGLVWMKDDILVVAKMTERNALKSLWIIKKVQK